MEQKRQPRWKQLASVTVESGGKSIRYNIVKDAVLNTIHLCYSVGPRGIHTLDITRAFRHDEQEGLVETIAMAGTVINAQFHAMKNRSFDEAMEALALSPEQKKIQDTGHEVGLALYGDDPTLDDEALYDAATRASAIKTVPVVHLSTFTFAVRAGYEDAKVMSIKKARTTPGYNDAIDYTHWRLLGDRFWTPINDSLFDIDTGSTLTFIPGNNTSMDHECATCFCSLLGMKYIDEKISGPRDGIGPMYHHQRCAIHGDYKVEYTHDHDAMTRDKNAVRLIKESSRASLDRLKRNWNGRASDER